MNRKNFIATVLGTVATFIGIKRFKSQGSLFKKSFSMGIILREDGRTSSKIIVHESPIHLVRNSSGFTIIKYNIDGKLIETQYLENL